MSFHLPRCLHREVPASSSPPHLAWDPRHDRDLNCLLHSPKEDQWALHPKEYLIVTVLQIKSITISYTHSASNNPKITSRFDKDWLSTWAIGSPVANVCFSRNCLIFWRRSRHSFLNLHLFGLFTRWNVSSVFSKHFERPASEDLCVSADSIFS